MSPREPSSLDYSSLLHVLSLNRWRHSILHEEWKQAEVAAGRIAESPEPLWKWLGLLNLASTRLYRGRSQEALSLLDESAHAASPMRPMTAWSHALAAHVLLETGRPADGIERTRLAEREGAGERAEREAIFVGAVARARLGHWREAEEGVARLERALGARPAGTEMWRVDHLSGEIALARGDSAAAVHSLGRALASLPDGEVRLWFSLASAYLAADEATQAEKWFERIVGSADEHLDWPIPYVRSFYFLGRLGSREHCRRFVTCWGEGDLDLERVAEAQSKL